MRRIKLIIQEAYFLIDQQEIWEWSKYKIYDENIVSPLRIIW